MQELQASLPVGAMIQRRYIVESLLGKGRFASVYLVRDQRSQQNLFVLAEVINPNEQEKYRFTLEYVSLTPLHHHALPHVQYIFNDDKLSRTYLLMSYVEEPNIEMLRLQQSEKRFPLPQVMTIIAPVINAVSYLHHRSPPVIHQRIQPATIIVPPMGNRPVLIMLNLAKEDDSSITTLHSFAPGYSAKEQYSEEFNIRTDIYGIGATCYTLLTGIVPPDAPFRSTQMSDGETDPLKPVDEIVPSIPTSVTEAIQRAMSINAQGRFWSVEQFWEALRSSGRQLSLSIPGSTPSTSLPSPVVSKQAGERLVPTSVPKQPRAPLTTKLGVLLILLALLISLGADSDSLSRARSFPATRSSTPVSSAYTTLTRTYNGTILDVSARISTSMSLTLIRQSGGNIRGYLTIGPKLQGSGPFSGTIDTADHLQFTVTDTAGNATLFFEGQSQAATSLSGDYYRCSPGGLTQGGHCNQAPGSYGLWSVVLTSSG